MTTTAATHPSVAPLALILQINDSLAERSFADVTADDLWKRPTPQSNPMLWIWGHVVTTRVFLLNLLGETYDTGLGDAFGRGAALQEASEYPSKERIDAAAREVNTRLYARLAALTAEDVLKPATRAFTPAVKTLGDQISFLTMHDTYHVGQLGYVRKALGLPGVVG